MRRGVGFGLCISDVVAATSVDGGCRADSSGGVE
jgi:hypothetical protein